MRLTDRPFFPTNFMSADIIQVYQELVLIDFIITLTVKATFQHSPFLKVNIYQCRRLIRFDTDVIIVSSGYYYQRCLCRLVCHGDNYHAGQRILFSSVINKPDLLISNVTASASLTNRELKQKSLRSLPLRQSLQ